MVNPSYKTGFAPRDYEPRYPSLWRDCSGAFCPSLGASGSTLMDHSGYRRHSPITSDTLSTLWTHDGAYFDGTDKVVVPHDYAAKPPEVDEITFSCWLTRDQGTAKSLCTSAPSYGTPSFFCQITATGALKLYRSTYKTSVATIAVAAGVWRHVAVSNGNSRTRFYIDGKISDEQTQGAGLNRQSQFVFGDGFAGMWIGGLDDIMVHNRVLTDTEVALLAMRKRIAYEPRLPTYGYVAAGGGGGGSFDRHWTNYGKRARRLVPTAE